MSVPLSRLNSLNVQPNSLNPTASSFNIASMAINNSIRFNEEHEQTIKSLPIIKNLNLFESNLNLLIDSIQRYNPNQKALNDLLNSDLNVENSIKLLINHQNFGKLLNNLRQSNENLNNELLNILDELNQCRSILLDLPNSIETQFQTPSFDQTTNSRSNNESLTVDELLKYAARLAKFTTIPATTEFNIGPANYIWPGEDSLRKGMLAAASNHQDQLISLESTNKQLSEIVDSKPESLDNNFDNVDKLEDLHHQNNINRPQSRNHTSSNNINNPPPPPLAPAPAPAPMINKFALDLYHSDDDDD
ncbi:Med4p ASCRUDRAFT_77670 [Ascoidea rubescens DSM 1968]|uniref:Mediator of RNA polymerase II transcription subunit 4 n=1 Tax=Ascoidea rubescens DSM 1968 TaxID=1344418 RepID=A0A1D2VAE3_9ASCO|nr:hypothetical protein ASCRUDRAFT_77670 [Ascoidea rubescens DSM 1968]ODV58656.1 hypothetical protein ASCRUDRAFT_77670 [Ascoidea rubescens DSM 1968]